jgi:hypothetical protein
MERVEEMTQFAKQCLAERFERNLNLIEKEYEEDSGSITKGFIGTFDRLCGRCAGLQKQGLKKKIKYINIFFLQSSVITKSYDMQISLFDENFYFDNAEISEYWRPLFIMKYFDEDIGYFSELMKKRLPRVQDYEIEELRLKYAHDYFIVAGKFCKEIIPQILPLPSFEKMQKEDGFKILFGGYMDYASVLYPEEKDKL